MTFSLCFRKEPKKRKQRKGHIESLLSIRVGDYDEVSLSSSWHISQCGRKKNSQLEVDIAESEL